MPQTALETTTGTLGLQVLFGVLPYRDVLRSASEKRRRRRGRRRQAKRPRAKGRLVGTFFTESSWLMG